MNPFISLRRDDDNHGDDGDKSDEEEEEVEEEGEHFHGPGNVPGTWHSRYLKLLMTLRKKYDCFHFKCEKTESLRGSH